MKYGIVFSVDCMSGVSNSSFVPDVVRQTCEQTEDDDCYEYGYLEDEWEGGHHSKWVGVLSQTQFDDFLESTGLLLQEVETMGTLGAPWSPSSIAPAISFIGGDCETAIQDAYVTPIPDIDIKNRVMDEEWQGRCWDRISQALSRRYG